MNKLFLKIFASFWLVAMLTVGIMAIIDKSLPPPDADFGFGAAGKPSAETLVADAQSVLNEYGLESLREWLNQSFTTSARPIFIIDENGRDILNRPIPPFFAKEQPQRHPAMARLFTRRFGKLETFEITSGDNTSYRMIVPPRPPISAYHRMLRFPWMRPLALLTALFVSSLICFLLARYFTVPLLQLRSTGKQVGSGTLSARVSPSIAKRGDEIGELGRDFNEMIDRIDQLVNAQKRLLRDVSHELRSPLARLQVAVDLIRQRHEEISKNELDKVDEEIENLNELIGQILTFVRLEMDSKDMLMEEIDLSMLLENIVENANYEARRHSREVALSFPEKICMPANEVLLHSALENIVRNAVHYTRENTTVEISVASDDREIRISVRDHGPGVPDSALSHIFEPFYRVSESRNRESGGGGIGLAIADRAIRLHKGAISASNIATGGLSVEIRLPAVTGNSA